MPQTPRRQQGSGGMGPPPSVPAGLPVSGGAAALKQSYLAPHTPVRGKAGSMPPPPLPLSAARSAASSTSSRPSLASDVSGDSGWLSRSPRPSVDERIKTPLQEMSGSGDNIGRPGDVESQFEGLLESLEVPSSVRMKFATVHKDVKASILESSMTSNPALLASLGLSSPAPKTPSKTSKGKLSTPRMRKVKSSSSLNGKQPQTPRRGDEFVNVASPAAGAMSGSPHSRGYSVDMGRPQPPFSSSRPGTPARSRPSSAFMPQSPARRGEKVGPPEMPDDYVRWLAAFKGTDIHMDVGKAKKLRMLLRHETTGWVAAFLDAGGYARILDRIQDLLDIEWREEQHDDQMLYELLRCVKALGTSEVGKDALRAAHPRPFPALSSLLFSEKKPGDLACRQIMVELWLFHFELFAPQPPSPGMLGSAPPHDPSFNVTYFVRSLLLPDNNDKTKDYHDFVQAAHRPRIFKAWVQELSDICRDYFWIMCHASNTLWQLSEVDEKLVERPVAPGGATGGVEFEAMGYVSTHFKLLNTLATHLAKENPEDARKLHQDLMLSGMDRILVTMRKASTTYYPTLHLELARYIEVMRLASDGKLPYLIGKLVGPPPEELRRHRSASEWLPRLKLSDGPASPARR